MCCIWVWTHTSGCEVCRVFAIRSLCKVKGSVGPEDQRVSGSAFTSQLGHSTMRGGQVGQSDGLKRSCESGDLLIGPEAKRRRDITVFDDFGLDTSLATIFHMGVEGMSKSGRKRRFKKRSRFEQDPAGMFLLETKIDDVLCLVF